MFRHKILSVGGPVSDAMPAVGSERRLVGMTVHVSAAPGTSESLTVTLDSGLGAQYDTLLYSLDLSTASTTDVLKTDYNLPLFPGDALRTAYANTDGNTIGITLLLS